MQAWILILHNLWFPLYSQLEVECFLKSLQQCRAFYCSGPEVGHSMNHYSTGETTLHWYPKEKLRRTSYSNFLKTFFYLFIFLSVSSSKHFYVVSELCQMILSQKTFIVRLNGHHIDFNISLDPLNDGFLQNQLAIDF